MRFLISLCLLSFAALGAELFDETGAIVANARAKNCGFRPLF